MTSILNERVLFAALFIAALGYVGYTFPPFGWFLLAAVVIPVVLFGGAYLLPSSFRRRKLFRERVLHDINPREKK